MKAAMALLGVAAAATACSGSGGARNAAQAKLDRGRYLVDSVGCSDRHTDHLLAGCAI